MFTSPAKREISRFHVVVVQRRQRNVQKVCCTCRVLVLPIKFNCFFCRSRCYRRRRRGCLTSVLVVVMMTTTTTTTDDDATTMTTTTTKTMMMVMMMMMMMMISYVSQEHSRAGSSCFWKLRVKVIHYSFTRKQNSISFFFRRNGETVVIAKNKWSPWYESSVLKELMAQFSAVTAKSAKIQKSLTSTSSGRNQSKFLLRSTNSLVVFNRFREHETILMIKLKENMKYRSLFNHFNRGRVAILFIPC